MSVSRFASTRRKFLFDCSAVAAVALAAPTGVVAESIAPFWRKRSLQEITCSDLTRQLNTTFHIKAGSGRTIKVALAEVKIRPEKPLKPGQHPPKDAGHEKFSLIFSGSRDELLSQDAYSFEHRTLGRFDLFIVPICTRNPSKIDYQAVVNRPRNHNFNENQTKG
jgi:hypothetical protein